MANYSWNAPATQQAFANVNEYFKNLEANRIAQEKAAQAAAQKDFENQMALGKYLQEYAVKQQEQQQKQTEFQGLQELGKRFATGEFKEYPQESTQTQILASYLKAGIQPSDTMYKLNKNYADLWKALYPQMTPEQAATLANYEPPDKLQTTRLTELFPDMDLTDWKELTSSMEQSGIPESFIPWIMLNMKYGKGDDPLKNLSGAITQHMKDENIADSEKMPLYKEIENSWTKIQGASEDAYDRYKDLFEKRNIDLDTMTFEDYTKYYMNNYTWGRKLWKAMQEDTALPEPPTPLKPEKIGPIDWIMNKLFGGEKQPQIKEQPVKMGKTAEPFFDPQAYNRQATEMSNLELAKIQVMKDFNVDYNTATKMLNDEIARMKGVR